MFRLALPLVVAAALLAACGDDSTSDSASTTAASNTSGATDDCAMTAAAALRTYNRLARRTVPSRSDTGLVLHKGSGQTVATRADDSPDRQRDMFVLVNAQRAGVLGLRGSSGTQHVILRARPGCGAVGSLRHERPYRAEFSADGKPGGSTQPTRRSE